MRHWSAAWRVVVALSKMGFQLTLIAILAISAKSAARRSGQRRDNLLLSRCKARRRRDSAKSAVSRSWPTTLMAKARAKAFSLRVVGSVLDSDSGVAGNAGFFVVGDQLSAAGAENVVIVIPPRRSAVSAGPTDGPWAQRDTALERIRQVGRREWQKESGYRQQARVENSFFRYKSVLGGGLKARHGKAQRREVAIGCHILNRMAELGRPNPALWCPEREVGKAPPLAPQLNHATAPRRNPRARNASLAFGVCHSVLLLSALPVTGAGGASFRVRVWAFSAIRG